MPKHIRPRIRVIRTRVFTHEAPRSKPKIDQELALWKRVLAKKPHNQSSKEWVNRFFVRKYCSRETNETYAQLCRVIGHQKLNQRMVVPKINALLKKFPHSFPNLETLREKINKMFDDIQNHADNFRISTFSHEALVNHGEDAANVRHDVIGKQESIVSWAIALELGFQSIERMKK
jgi:hypothetical protein